MAERKKRRNSNAKPRTPVTLSKLTFHKLNWLDYLAIGLGLWFLFYPHPYAILFTILLCLPVFGIVMSAWTGQRSVASLVDIINGVNDDDDGYYPTEFIVVPAWVIMIRTLIDYEVESYYSLILPGTVAFIITLILLFLTHNQVLVTKKSKFLIYATLIGNVCIYSTAGIYGANCVYDTSEPEVYQALVLDKRISSGKSTSYYLKVTPWGHHFDAEEIRVSPDHFGEVRVGQRVAIDRMEGLFHIPWYYIER